MLSQTSEKPEGDQAPRTVHLLAGHTTSEIDIARCSVYIPVAVAAKSEYLRSRMQPLSGYGGTIVIELPDVSPAALKLYSWWLKYENAPLFVHDANGPVAQPRHTLRWRECFDLVQAHVLGSRFDDQNFQRYILSQLDQWLEPQQEPDIELLDYLWETMGDIVSDELLCFAMAHMFKIKMQRVRVMVAWMKGTMGRRRMMEYIEGIRSAGRGSAEDITMSSSEVRKPDQQACAGATGEEDNVSMQEAMIREAYQTLEKGVQDRSSMALLGKVRRQDAKSMERGFQNPAPSTESMDSKNRQGPPGSIPSSQRNVEDQSVPSVSNPLFTRKQLSSLTAPLKIHPKALERIANTNMRSTMEEQRCSNPQLPPPPNLHPPLRNALAQAPSVVRPRMLKDGGREKWRDSQQPLLESGAITMPPIADAALQFLDFWIDPSPSDLPGPDFWAGTPSDIPPQVPPKDTPTTRFPVSPNFPLALLSPTTKQIVQSFNLTRTPTPRRRATRSWSVASIRSLEKDDLNHRSSTARPPRSLISRKPVPEGGMTFLSRYNDGERLRRVISVNSRPRAMGLMVGPGEDGQQLWDRDWATRRPGTA